MLVRLPKTLNGRLTLKSIGELAKRYFRDTTNGYQYIWPQIFNELGDKSIDRSCWVLMTKDVFPGTRGKSYVEQQEIVAKLEKSLIGYKVPETLDAAVCILSQYFDSGTCLFSNKPVTYTRCKEKISSQLVVGGFSLYGLCVNDNAPEHDDFIGVAVLWKC